MNIIVPDVRNCAITTTQAIIFIIKIELDGSMKGRHKLRDTFCTVNLVIKEIATLKKKETTDIKPTDFNVNLVLLN
jgi:rRNA-processing protein FCF1